MGRQRQVYIRERTRARRSVAREDRSDRAWQIQPERVRVARVRSGRDADSRVDVREVTDGSRTPSWCTKPEQVPMH